jgi:hypothetical protein
MKHATRISNAIFAIKTNFPDLRLGQILINASEGDDRVMDLFYIEDDELARLLEKHIVQLKGMK